MKQYINGLLITCSCCGKDQVRSISYENHMNLFGRGVRKLIYILLGTLYFKTGVYRLIGPLLSRKIKEFFYKRMIFCKGRLVVCMNCGHGQEVGNIEPHLVALFYDDVYGTGAHVDKAIYCQLDYYINNSRAIGQFDICNRSIDLNKVNTILEIGGGPCHISRYLRHYNPNILINVVESGEFWRELYKIVDISLVGVDFNHKSNNQVQYDLVIMSHSLEHFSDLEIVADSVFSLIAKNGYLLIEVPHCPDAYFEIDASDIPHLQFFTEKSLVALFDKRGMDLLASSTTGSDLSTHVRHVEEDEDERVKILKSFEKNISRKNGCYLRCLFKMR